MHNIEPAHHAVQQEVDWIGRRKSKQPVTRFVRVVVVVGTGEEGGEIRWGRGKTWLILPDTFNQRLEKSKW